MKLLFIITTIILSLGGGCGSDKGTNEEFCLFCNDSCLYDTDCNFDRTCVDGICKEKN